MNSFIKNIANRLDHTFFPSSKAPANSAEERAQKISNRALSKPVESLFDQYIEPLKATDYSLLLGSATLAVAIIVGIVALKRFGKSCLPLGIWFSLILVSSACIVVRIRLNRHFDSLAAVHVGNILMAIQKGSEAAAIQPEINNLKLKPYSHRKEDWLELNTHITTYQTSNKSAGAKQNLIDYLTRLQESLGVIADQV